MRPFPILLTTFLAALVPPAAQDYSDLNSSIKEFTGVKEEVVKKNALLSTGASAINASKGGVDSVMTGLGLKKAPPPLETPTIRLSKEQQALVDKEMARKAKADAAKADAPKPGVAKSAAAKPPTTKAGVKPAQTRPVAGTRAAVRKPAAVTPTVAKTPAPAAVAIAPPPSAPAKPEPKRVREESVQSITEGMDRAQLLASLGPPRSASAITGLEGGPRETLTYELESGQFVFVKVLGGKVQSISR